MHCKKNICPAEILYPEKVYFKAEGKTMFSSVNTQAGKFHHLQSGTMRNALEKEDDAGWSYKNSETLKC